MSLKITRWRPDTCGCILDYQWDDTQDENNRTHSFSRVIATCPEHFASNFSGASLWTVVKDENIRKNKALTLAQTLKPDLQVAEIPFSFNAQRVLILEVGNLFTSGERSQLQHQLDATLGLGQVIIRPEIV